jgi:hypothetical protein
VLDTIYIFFPKMGNGGIIMENNLNCCEDTCDIKKPTSGCEMTDMRDLPLRVVW